MDTPEHSSATTASRSGPLMKAKDTIPKVVPKRTSNPHPISQPKPFGVLKTQEKYEFVRKTLRSSSLHDVTLPDYVWGFMHSSKLMNLKAILENKEIRSSDTLRSLQSPSKTLTKDIGKPGSLFVYVRVIMGSRDNDLVRKSIGYKGSVGDSANLRFVLKKSAYKKGSWVSSVDRKGDVPENFMKTADQIRIFDGINENYEAVMAHQEAGIPNSVNLETDCAGILVKKKCLRNAPDESCAIPSNIELITQPKTRTEPSSTSSTVSTSESNTLFKLLSGIGLSNLEVHTDWIYFTT